MCPDYEKSEEDNWENIIIMVEKNQLIGKIQGSQVAWRGLGH